MRGGERTGEKGKEIKREREGEREELSVDRKKEKQRGREQ